MSKPTSAKNGPVNNGKSPEEVVAELTAERDALRKEVAGLKDERRHLVTALNKLMPVDFTMTKEEMDNLKEHGVTWDRVLSELQAIKGSD